MKAAQPETIFKGIFIGASAMGALLRSHDWEKTQLGSVETWPQSLKTTLNILFNTCCPMFLVWGYDRILFYNDAYAHLLTENHVSQFFGQPVNEAIQSIWGNIYSEVKQVFSTGQPLQREHQPFPTMRDNHLETPVYTWCYSPLWDEAGQVGGVFATGSRLLSEHKQTEGDWRKSEERFHLLTQAVNGLIFDWNLQTNEVYRSNKLYDLMGIYPEEAPSDASWWHERVHPDDVTRLQPQLTKLFTGSNHFYHAEYRVRHKDGHWVDVWEQACLVRDEQGQVIRLVGCTVDISEWKQAIQALRKSEERFRISQELSLDAFTILDALRDETGTIVDFVWTYVNPKAAEILQHPATELVGQRLLEVLPGNQLNSELFKRYVQVVETGQPHDIELSYEADGITGWFRNMAVRLEEGIAIFFTDITDRKRFEQALVESETIARTRAEELATLMEITPAAIWIARDPHCHQITANQTAYQLMRVKPGGVTTATPEDGNYLLPFKMCQNGQELLPQDLPMQTAIRMEQEVTGEVEFVFEDGTVQSIYGKTVPLYGSAGEVRGAIAAFIDITERKQAEEDLRESERRFRRLVESNMFGVAFGDFTGGVHYVNDYFLNMVGYTREEIETKQIKWTDLTPPEFLPLDGKAMAELRFKGVATPFEKEYIRKDGSHVPILIGAALLQEPYDQSQEIIAFYIDLTQQKQAESERERLLKQAQVAREEAETANRIKDEFLAVLSHELRSPLNPILGWSKLLQTKQFDELGTKRALQTIERNAKLQTQLIEDLLDVSRILQGKLVLNTCSVNLVTIVESALETVRLAAEAKQIRIQTVVTLNHAETWGDSARLQQIIWNLLSNAVKFTPDGGQIEVRLEQANRKVPEEYRSPSLGYSTAHPYAQITVSDTGKGINSTFLPYVFDYFRQEDGKTTRKFGGLGLGLAIVRHLTELHGGTVHVDSPGEGQGATFTIRLPLIMVKTESDNRVPVTDQFIDLRQLHILIVDDDEDMRALTQVILEQQGARVIVADSATEALKLFEQQPPDLLISDIGMPDINGYMLMQQIRQRSPEQGGLVPAIALTAYAGEYDQQQALKVGFQKHISKPVDPETLVKAITDLIL